MLARNLLFIILALGGIGALAYQLSPENRIADETDYRPWRSQKDDFQAIVNKVNLEFQEHWKANELTHTERADDLTIARRISLGLMGTIPSLEEIRAFEAQKPKDRIAWWMSRVLDDQRFSDFVAERLARAYVGTENGQFIVYRRRRFVHWVSDALEKDVVRYDRLVQQLLTDEGLWTDTPSVNFMTVTVDDSDDANPDPITLAAKTSRAFLGMRIDCLQCHDNNLAEEFSLGSGEDIHDGLQRDFHQLAAFFGKTTSSGAGIRELGKDPYKYKFLGEENEEPVEPKVPYSPHLLNPKGTQRQQLASWITHKENKPFARAIVNRIWALMCGQPLIDPVDNIPLYPEKLPPGLESLADDLVEHRFDLKRLMRVIAATDVFQSSSRSEKFEITDKHEEHWAAFPLTRLRAEQVAGTIIQASSLTTINARSHIIAQLRSFAETNDFVQRYGDLGEDEFEDRGGTIPQRLLLMNGDLANGERIEGDGPLLNACSQIAVMSPTNKKAIEIAYLAALTRRATAREEEHFLQTMKNSNRRNRARQIEDIYWILINSTEFSWNH